MLSTLALFENFEESLYNTPEKGTWERKVNVAGIDPSELSVEYSAKNLILKNKGKAIHAIFVPKWVDVETITSEYAFGVLSFSGEKEKSLRPRKIEIAVREDS